MNISDIHRNSLTFSAVRTGEPYLAEPDTHVPLTEGTTHIWSALYTDLDRYYPFLSALLSPEDSLKAAGFKKTGDTRRYILRHGMVRAILGQYTQQEPGKIQFILGEPGKPDLDPEANIPEIRFSLSRTDEMVCLGITRKSEIGLDIIKIDAHYPFLETAEYLFPPDERSWIAQAAPEDRPLRFFRIWCLKEALLKATGSDVHMMMETDVSGIMTGHLLDGFYPVQRGDEENRFFIHESGCGEGHHRVMVTLPERETGSLNWHGGRVPDNNVPVRGN